MDTAKGTAGHGKDQVRLEAVCFSYLCRASHALLLFINLELTYLNVLLAALLLRYPHNFPNQEYFASNNEQKKSFKCWLNLEV